MDVTTTDASSVLHRCPPWLAASLPLLLVVGTLGCSGSAGAPPTTITSSVPVSLRGEGPVGVVAAGDSLWTFGHEVVSWRATDDPTTSMTWSAAQVLDGAPVIEERITDGAILSLIADGEHAWVVTADGAVWRLRAGLASTPERIADPGTAGLRMTQAGDLLVVSDPSDPAVVVGLGATDGSVRWRSEVRHVCAIAMTQASVQVLTRQGVRDDQRSELVELDPTHGSEMSRAPVASLADGAGTAACSMTRLGSGRFVVWTYGSTAAPVVVEPATGEIEALDAPDDSRIGTVLDDGTLLIVDGDGAQLERIVVVERDDPAPRCIAVAVPGVARPSVASTAIDGDRLWLLVVNDGLDPDGVVAQNLDPPAEEILPADQQLEALEPGLTSLAIEDLRRRAGSCPG